MEINNAGFYADMCELFEAFEEILQFWRVWGIENANMQL